jgi:fructose-1,6-bisphosphatase/inositol monophosphatase family enzyme
VWTDWVKGDNTPVYTLLQKLKSATTYPRIAMCATQTLMMVAGGLLDGYVHAGPGPEDIAAAAYIVEQAGGTVTTIDGAPWSPFGSSSIVATGGGDFHAKLLKLIG